MDEPNEITSIKKQVETLRAELNELRKTTGGILSTVDLRDRLVPKEMAEKYLVLFKDRRWGEIKKLGGANEGGEKEGGEFEKKFLVQKFNELNLTPFSYDLSIGDEVFSIQQPRNGVVELGAEPYNLAPGETIIVITRELIALPHAYSATVWPRFSMVMKGIFQSMVKIDPTWYGKLAVAMSNLSPAVIPIRRDEAFATLLLYELSKPSDVDLWRYIDIKDITISCEVPKEFHDQTDRLSDWLFEFEKGELRKYFRLEDKKLIGNGIKRRQIEALSEFIKSDNWVSFVDGIAEKWATCTHPRTGNRMIVMNGLGMSSLREIVKGAEYDGYLSPDEFTGKACATTELSKAAVQYGKPFDVFAQIPDAVIQRIEEETIPKSEAEMESKIQIRMIILVFSLFGFVSLAVTILVTLWRLVGSDFSEVFFNWAGMYAVVVIAAAMFGLGFILLGRTGSKRTKQAFASEKDRIAKKKAELKEKEEKLSTDESKLAKDSRRLRKENTEVKSEVKKLRKEFADLRKKVAKSEKSTK